MHAKISKCAVCSNGRVSYSDLCTKSMLLGVRSKREKCPKSTREKVSSKREKYTCLELCLSLAGEEIHFLFGFLRYSVHPYVHTGVCPSRNIVRIVA